MRTFKHLEFKPHSLGYESAKHAKMKFKDGSTISVITGDRSETGFYCTEGVSYEMQSNRTNRNDGIRGWLSPKQITRHMTYIQNNPLNPKT